jgi:hypothetical protein
MVVRRRTWGMSDVEWAAACARLTALLASAASRRSTVTYGEAARVAFDGRFSARSGALMDLLGDVDSVEDERRGVMVASLVVRADSGIPGDGYFAFAANELGRDISDREAFWRSEVEAVWASYGSDEELR